MLYPILILTATSDDAYLFPIENIKYTVIRENTTLTSAINHISNKFEGVDNFTFSAIRESIVREIKKYLKEEGIDVVVDFRSTDDQKQINIHICTDISIGKLEKSIDKNTPQYFKEHFPTTCKSRGGEIIMVYNLNQMKNSIFNHLDKWIGDGFFALMECYNAAPHRINCIEYCLPLTDKTYRPVLSDPSQREDHAQLFVKHYDNSQTNYRLLVDLYHSVVMRHENLEQVCTDNTIKSIAYVELYRRLPDRVKITDKTNGIDKDFSILSWRLDETQWHVQYFYKGIYHAVSLYFPDYFDRVFSERGEIIPLNFITHVAQPHMDKMNLRKWLGENINTLKIDDPYLKYYQSREWKNKDGKAERWVKHFERLQQMES